MTNRYWFARRSADSAGRPMPHTVQPVSWEGWAVVAACSALIGLGALLWVDAARQGLPGGWMGLVFLTVVGGGGLTAATGAKTDPTHGAVEYKAGRVKNNENGPENA